MSPRHLLTATEKWKWHSALTVGACTVFALTFIGGTEHCVNLLERSSNSCPVVITVEHKTTAATTQPRHKKIIMFRGESNWWTFVGTVANFRTAWYVTLRANASFTTRTQPRGTNYDLVISPWRDCVHWMSARGGSGCDCVLGEMLAAVWWRLCVGPEIFVPSVFQLRFIY